MRNDDALHGEAALAKRVDAIGLHIFTGEIREEGYTEVFTGPGVETFLGGCPPADVSSDAVWPTLVHPDDWDAYEAAMDRIHGGEPGDVEYRMIGYDGVTRWVWERGRPRRLGDGRLLVDGFALDVTALRHVSAELAETRAHLHRVVNSIEEHLYTAEFRPDGSYEEIFTGPGSERFLGGPVPIGADPVATWDAQVHPEDRDWVRAIYAARARGESNEVSYRLIGLDGVVRWVSDRAYPRRTSDGRLLIDGIVSDISEQKCAEAELRDALIRLEQARADADQRSRVDSLTGVYNRRHVSEVLAAELDRASREGTTPAVLLLDLDHFKSVNDRYGHLAGDAVLVEAASRLAASVRPYDCVARWGGEEFAVVVPNVGSEDALRGVADSLRQAIDASPFLVEDGSELALTASIGAVRASVDVWSSDDLVDAADQALYVAKRRGRNRTHLRSDILAGGPVAHEPETLAIAQALALAAAVRHGGPLGLPDRVADLAGDVAERLVGVGALALRCRLGGWLLDVGRVTVLADQPVPDRLELLGEGVVRRIAGLHEAAPAVRHQDEHWDGTGAPDGLAGDEIPIEARIVSACRAYAVAEADGFDASTVVEALAGSVLDPKIVAALVALADSSTA